MLARDEISRRTQVGYQEIASFDFVLLRPTSLPVQACRRAFADGETRPYYSAEICYALDLGLSSSQRDALWTQRLREH